MSEQAGYRYILHLAVAFLLVAGLLDVAGFWALAGLNEPRGFWAMGLLFLSLVFVLQRGLFEPYLRVREERERETAGKTALAAELKRKAEMMNAERMEAIERTRLEALRASEREALAAEAEERSGIQRAREENTALYAQSAQGTASESVIAAAELMKSLDSIAGEIVACTLGNGPYGSAPVNKSAEG